jgi:hypothetical protein
LNSRSRLACRIFIDGLARTSEESPTEQAVASDAIVPPRAHLAGRNESLVSVAPLIERCGGRFTDLIDAPAPALTGREPRPRKRGPKTKDKGLSNGSPQHYAFATGGRLCQARPGHDAR